MNCGCIVLCFMALVVSCTLADDPNCPDSCTCATSNKLIRCENLNVIPSGIPGYTDYMFLNCHFNNIEAGNIDGYSDAVTLQINNCQVSGIEDSAFSGLTNLETLTLQDNDLRNVTKGMFQGLDSLKKLDLTGNRFTELASDAFSQLDVLEDLTLSNNGHLVLNEDSFKSAPNLRSLTIGGCDQSSLPTQAFQAIPSLTTLHFDHNKVSVLPSGGLRGIPELTFLSLDSCSIKTIEEGAFEGLAKLEYLNLGYNRLTELSKSALAPVKASLRKILLENNELSTLHEDMLTWENIQEFKLGHNPWNCDCDLHWIVKLNLAHAVAHDPENVTCSAPEHLKGRQIGNLTQAMMCDCDGGECGGKNVVALAVGIPILIICVLLIGYYVFKIIQNRRRRQTPKKVRYESVYKDTVESGAPKSRPLSEL